MATTGETTAITGASALVGRDLVAVADRTVVVSNGVIARVGGARDVSVPPGATVVEANGLTLVPGFVDAHVHIGFHSPAEVLRGGVTTARDLGWPPESIWPLVAKSAEASFDGPAIHAVGPIITAPGGYPSRAGWAPPGTALEVSGTGAARAAVDDVHAVGAINVKIALNPPVGPVFDAATLAAITDQAHGHGLKVSAHVHGLHQLHAALDAGVDELAHMLLGPEKIPDGTTARMVAQSMTVVPTLSIRFGLDRRRAIDNLRRFLEAGGRVVYGTDLGNSGPRPGIDPREIAAMSKAGMTPKEIIRSATVDAADWLNLKGIGVLEEGHPADIVALAGNPLTTPKHLTDVRMLWRAGHRAL
jgi:imidazolonepropionase-like amidohydrolase